MNADRDENSPGRSPLKKGFFILLGVLAAGILCCALYRSVSRTAARLSRDFMSPFLKSGAAFTGMVRDRSLLSKGKGELAASCVYLERRVFALENALAAAEKAGEENQQLRALLNLKRRRSFRPVRAEIIARSPSAWRSTFTIGRGTADGIRIGDSVAAPGPGGRIVFAGRITEVSRHTAVAATVFSLECRVSVSLGTGETGAMEFSPEAESPVIRYLPAGLVCKEGTPVFTSGSSLYTPEGIPVGYVRKPGNRPVVQERNHLDSSVVVEPSVQIDSVRFVAVYTRFGKRKAEE